MMLLTKQGEIITKAPEGCPVNYDGTTTIEKIYRVRTFHKSRISTVVLGEEDFNTEPTAIQILYCLLRYKGEYPANQVFSVTEEVYTMKDNSHLFENDELPPF